MKIKDLENAPDWLKNATVSDEDVEIINGIVHWYDGIWEYGTWKDGTWHGGIWENGVWYNGIWENGKWEYGIWKNGKWEYGIWYDGKWEYGTWKNGVWYGGEWCGGTWHDGITSIKSKYNICYKNDIVYIGCKLKTFEEWDDWFKNSTEEFNTPRNTKEFNMIKQVSMLLKPTKKL